MKKIFSLVMAITLCFLLFGCGGGSSWEQDISISGGDWVANGYKNGSAEGGSLFDVAEKGDPYYEYEITNETSTHLKDVVVVFSCEGKEGARTKKWTYKFDVGKLNPSETKTIKVKHWDMFPEEYDDPGTYWSTDHNIKKVTYKKEK